MKKLLPICLALVACACMSSVNAQNEFTSPDLKWAGLQGHVKSVTESYTEDGQTYTINYRFSQDGKLTYYRDSQYEGKASIKRNKVGRVYKLSIEDEIDGSELTYSYDKNGYVRSSEEEMFQSGRTTTYTRNAKGWPVSAKSEAFAWFGPAEYVYYRSWSFQYTKTDSRGNWTHCIQKSTLTYYHENYPDEQKPKKNTQVTVVRRIVYY